MKRLLATVLLAAMLCTVLVLVPAKETATEVFALDMPTTNGRQECTYYLPSASGNVKVTADFIPSGYGQRPGTTQTQKYLVIHNTGNYASSASAYNHYEWLTTSSGTGQSYHYVCGSDGIYQLLPENEKGAHTGSNKNSSGTYDSVARDVNNSNAIGIETCVNGFPASASYSGEKWNTDAMYAWYTNYFATRTDYLAILAASILVRNNFDPNTRCVQHYVVYGKNCPMQMRYVFYTAGTSGYSGGSNTSHFTKMGTYYTIFWNRMMAYYNAFKNGGEAVMPDGSTSGTVGGIYKVSTSGDTLNIRDQATSSGSNVIGEIPNGTEIKVTAYEGNWGKTTYNGVTGWVSMSYLTYVSALPVEKDEEAPVISDAKITNLDTTGYTVSCKVSDNKGVTKIIFPTWTDAGGQDDIKWYVGSVSNGSATYRINISEFNNAGGLYNTHIYAYDAAGNQSAAATLSTTVYPTGFTLVSGSNATLTSSVLKPAGAGNTVDSIKNSFACEITVLNASGSALAATANVGTGCTVVQYDTDGSTVLNRVTVIVNGDLDGDGLINSSDVTAHKAHIRAVSKLVSHFLTASDFNGDGKVNTLDYIRLKLAV